VADVQRRRLGHLASYLVDRASVTRACAALFADRRDRVGWLAGAILSELSPAERRTLARTIELLPRMAEH
jgi:hypothetical protein